MGYLQKNKDITNLSSFKTPATAKYYFEINQEQNIDDLVEIVQYWNKKELPLLFIGQGTNMLFAFNQYHWIVIKNNLFWWVYNQKNNILKCYSSELISDIAESLEQNYKQNIWHRFIWLPWSIGWAVFGNAWCFWLEIENNFMEAKVIDLESRQVLIISKNDMKFSYRNSILKEKKGKYFLVSAQFDLSKKIEKYSSDVDNIHFRAYKQPKGNTCGSFFKNPSREFSAGYLIEQVWLKGHKIWGAYFSNLHANFLMNEDNGRYEDLLELIELAKKKVKGKFGIDLVNEVRIITNTSVFQHRC